MFKGSLWPTVYDGGVYCDPLPRAHGLGEHPATSTGNNTKTVLHNQREHLPNGHVYMFATQQWTYRQTDIQTDRQRRAL